MLILIINIVFSISGTYCAESTAAPSVSSVQNFPDGSYKFRYATRDEGNHYHVASASANNVVAGRYGYRDAALGGDAQTVYTAGPKGFRANGPNIARITDLSQDTPPFSRPNNDGKYRPELDNINDPNEDPSYSYSVKTPEYSKDEKADSLGDVQGRYSYIDDVGVRHNVEYVAGSRTGFLVTNSVPDSVAHAQGGPLYYQGKNPSPKIRGHHTIQRKADGSYSFVSSGPDQTHSEVADAIGNRRGQYTFLDDRGVEHTVRYIAGPKIGFKVLDNGLLYKPPEIFIPGTDILKPPHHPRPPPYPPGPPPPRPSTTTPTPVSSTPISSTTPEDDKWPEIMSGNFLEDVHFQGFPNRDWSNKKPTTEKTPSVTITPPPVKPTLTPTPGYGLYADQYEGRPGYSPQPVFPVINQVPQSYPGYDPSYDLGNINSNFPEFEGYHHQLFPDNKLFADGLKTAESSRYKPKKYGSEEKMLEEARKQIVASFEKMKYNAEHGIWPVKKSDIPPPPYPPAPAPPVEEYLAHLAKRAHVQSLDLPYEKRFISPSEALAAVTH